MSINPGYWDVDFVLPNFIPNAFVSMPEKS